MTYEEYEKIEAVRWSDLKEMRRSPLRYHYRLHNPREDSVRFKNGRAAHTCLFESDRFAIDYAVWRGDRRAGKEWDKFCEANRGRTIIKLDEYARCLGIRDAVKAHPVAGLLVTGGEAEVSLTWTDEATGLPCKARLDYRQGVNVSDLKTTFDIDARRFASTCARMGHHIQAALYRRACRANGIDPVMRIIAVEAEEPYEVAVYLLSDDTLYAGDEELDGLLAQVAAGRFSGKWPGRYDEEQTLELPAWAFEDEQDLDGVGLIVGAEESA